MWIKKTVNQLKKKYKTDCPYQLAEYLNVRIMYHNLHLEINGFYKYDRRNKYIIINDSLDKYDKRFTCAHELGHAFMHPRLNTPFMRRNTFLSIDKKEREANRFAAELLIPDEAIAESNNIYELASLYGVPVELVKLKLFCKEDLF